MLVLTLLARDEADVVDASIAFHLSAGVDFVIATDHRSEDGTREILEGYERNGVLRLIREDAVEFDSQALRTRMARLAAEEHGADWVIGADADEFFWPNGGSLADVLAAVPSRYGVVQAPWRVFVPRPDGPDHFAERMVVRLAGGSWPSHPNGSTKPDVKIAHRGDPRVVVQGGNHRLLSGGVAAVPRWYPIEVLHFSVRSVEQLERRMAHWSRAGREWKFEVPAIADARSSFAALAVGEELVAEGLASGAFAVDTRLRDALREMSMPSVPTRSESEDSGYRSLLAALDGRSLHRVQRRLDDLGARVAALESSGPSAGDVG